jgi:hypothetical protein
MPEITARRSRAVMAEAVLQLRGGPLAGCMLLTNLG